MMGLAAGFSPPFPCGPRRRRADAVVEIRDAGAARTVRRSGSTRSAPHRAGQTLRWTNRDPGNSHTVTAYHPKMFERPLRMPEGARPWNSDYLLPDETFTVTLTKKGVYDYYCVPHEHAGMVGRIVVEGPQATGRPTKAGGGEGRPSPVADEGLPEVALQGFPSVERDNRKGIVRRRLRCAGRTKWSHAASSMKHGPDVRSFTAKRNWSNWRGKGGENAVRELVRRNNQRLFRVARADRAQRRGG